MSTHEAGEKGQHHPSFGERIKGAAHVVHGLGENIRGSVMGAVESISGSEEGKNKEEDIVSKGRSEIEQGIAQMKGPGGATAAPEPRIPAQGQTGDQSQPPPPPPQPEKEQVATQPPAPTGSGPTQGAVGMESRKAETEAGRQEPAGQTDQGMAQQSSQEKQAATETQSPQTGYQPGVVAGGANAPQGPGSNV